MIQLLLDWLAVFRLVRLVTEDVITAAPREAVIRAAYVTKGREAWALDQQDRLNVRGNVDAWVETVAHDADPPKLATLVTCPWCSGMWLALGVVALRRLVPRAWAPMAEALAASAVAGLVASNLDA